MTYGSLWRPEEIEHLCHLVRIEGLTFTEAARRLGRSRSSCCKKFRRQHGYQRPVKRIPTHEEATRIVWLKDVHDMTFQAIADKLGMSPSRVRIAYRRMKPPPVSIVPPIRCLLNNPITDKRCSRMFVPKYKGERYCGHCRAVVGTMGSSLAVAYG